MNGENYITIISNKKKVVLKVDTILYVVMRGNNAEIHASGGNIYITRITFKELEEKLGDGFIKLYRGCLVSVLSIHEITDIVCLCNGETLNYAKKRKNEIIDLLRKKQKEIINSFRHDGIPMTDEKYTEHYKSFETLPFAFADIELIFNEENHAVDWIFRYGNPALAELEKVPLETLIGNSFGTLFPNMDSKWLMGYERATLYGEIHEIIDYSPEIDTYLKVICFPTFEGHCGCILFNISDIQFSKTSSEAEKALMLYFGRTVL